MLTLSITEIAMVREAMATAVLLVDLTMFRGDMRPISPIGLNITEKTLINRVVQIGTKSEAPIRIKKTEMRLKTRLLVGRIITTYPRAMTITPISPNRLMDLTKKPSKLDRLNTLIGRKREAS